MPTPGDVHVNRPLTNISVAYEQSADTFVASRIFPNVSVAKQSDIYFTYDRGEWNRDEMRERAPGTESAGGAYKLNQAGPYYCPQMSFHSDVNDPTRANADEPLQPDREATDYVTFKALLHKEVSFASKFMKTTVWSTDLAGVSGSPGAGEFKQWNDAASTPIEDVRGWKTDMGEATGFRPNTLLIGRRVFDKILDHPDIVDRVKYTSSPGNPAVVNMQSLAALFEIERILVMDAIHNAAKEGQAEASAFIVGKKALLAHVAPRPGLRTPSAGYTFGWTGLMGASAFGSRIRQFRMEHIQSDRVEIDYCFSQHKMGADLGIFLDTVVA